MKQNVEKEALEALANKFHIPINDLKDLDIDYSKFNHYLDTLANPYGVPITLRGALLLFDESFYVVQRRIY